MTQIIMAFVSMFLMDVVFALYTKSVIKNRPTMAGLYAAGIMLCNTVMVINVVDNHWMVIPVALGAFAGTWTAVRWL
jgi:hypothetical protein